MKKVIIINQNKGGVGKSFLSALILEKERKAESNFIMIDIDSGNRSTFKRFTDDDQSVYMNLVDEFSLLKGQKVDNGLFSELFQRLAESSKDKAYLDLGGNESREIITLIKTIGIEGVDTFFKEVGLEVHFYTVIKIGDRDCLDHLKNVMVTLKGSDIKHTCFVNSNSFDNATENNYMTLEVLCKKEKVNLKTFGKAPAGHVQEVVSTFVRSGFNSDLAMFKGVFLSMVNHLETE